MSISFEDAQELEIEISNDVTEIVIQDALGTTNLVVEQVATETVEIAVPGIQGPSNILSVGTVETTQPGTDAEVDITGTSPAQVLNLKIPRGDKGENNVITIGTVTTLNSRQAATASVTGVSPNQQLNLGLPAGAKILEGAGTPSGSIGAVGDWYIATSTWDMYEKTDVGVWTARLNIRGAVGPVGPPNVLSVGSVTTTVPGTVAEATITGSSPSQVLNLKIPRGDVGAPNTLTVSGVTTGAEGSNAAVTIGGTSPNQTIQFAIPRGNTGPANVLSIGTINTTAPGTSASASITGTAPVQVLSLNIPRGDTGAQGPPNVLTLGSVSTLAANASATVSITGTSPNQSISFGIPQGIQGIQGNRGATWYSGDGAPSNALGVNDDYYLNTNLSSGTGDVYRKVAGTWSINTNIRGLPGQGNIVSINGNTGPNVTIDYSTLGVIPGQYLPALAINEWFEANSEAAMLALVAQRGDMVRRTDTGKTYFLSTDNPGELTHWKQVNSDIPVTTVQGRIGDVVITKTDLGLNNVTNDAQVTLSTTQTITGYKGFSGGAMFTGGGGTFGIGPGSTDHGYISFYPRTASPSTRGAFLGFGTPGGNAMSVTNETFGGSLTLQANNGVVNAVGIALQENGVRVWSNNNIPSIAAFTTGVINEGQLPIRLGSAGGANATDMNAGVALESGWYDVIINVPNGPAGNSYSVGQTIQYRGNPGHAIQNVWEITGNRSWTRVQSGGNWNEWKQNDPGYYENRYSLNTHNHDSKYVDFTNAQTIGGIKTFTSSPAVPDNSWTISDTAGLQSALDTKALDSTVVKLVSNQTISGTKTFVEEIIGGNGLAGNVLRVGNDSRIVDIDEAHTMGLISTTDAAQGGIRLGSGFRLQANATNATATGNLTVTGTLTSQGNFYTPRVLADSVSHSGLDYGNASSLYATATGTHPHYGIGKFVYNDGVIPGGINLAVSGYAGVSLITGGAERLRISYQGNIIMREDMYMAENKQIVLGATGVAPPSFNTRSGGTRLVLYPNTSATSVDFALGIEGSSMWFSTYNAAQGLFKWYGGTTLAASLTGTGNFTVPGTVSAAAFAGAGGAITGVVHQTGNETVNGVKTFGNDVILGANLVNKGQQYFLDKPVGPGGWARGLFYRGDDASTVVGAFGAFGVGTSTDSLYISHGATPWVSPDFEISKTDGIYMRKPLNVYSTINAMNGQLSMHPSLATTAAVGAGFTNPTHKSYINLNVTGTNNNDPGYIMHELGQGDAGQNNLAVLHLVPSDDNSGNDRVSIHGSNLTESIGLYTDGRITTVGVVTAAGFVGGGTGLTGVVKTGSTNLVTGRTTFIGSIAGTSGWDGALEIQGPTPRIHFHWGSTVASNMQINSAGEFKFVNDVGTAYQNVRGGGIFDYDNRVYSASNPPPAAQPAAHDHQKIVVQDARNLPGSGNDANFMPTPADIGDHAVTSQFSMISGLAGPSWRGALTVKGWETAGYAAWQLIGTATTTADNDFYLRSGVNTTWNAPVKIHHSGNFDPATKANLTGGTFTGTITMGASALLHFGNTTLGLPTGSGTAAGAKIVLWGPDYAIGMAGSTLWNGVPSVTEQFAWYGGATRAMMLSGAGRLSLGPESGTSARLNVSSPGPSVPTLGAPNNYSAFFTNSDNQYGLGVGVRGTGQPFLQGQRIDSATSYELQLQPAGGDVRTGASLIVNGIIYGNGAGISNIGAENLTGTINNSRFPARLSVGGYARPAGGNWNNAVDTGWYAENAGTNGPSGVNGWLQVRVHQLADNPDYATQWATASANGGQRINIQYIRHKDAGTWGPWTEYHSKINNDTFYAPITHTHTTAQITGLDTSLAAKAPLASPVFTGTATSARFTGGSDTASNDFGSAGLETKKSGGFPSVAFHAPSQYAPQFRATSGVNFQFVNQAGDTLVGAQASYLTTNATTNSLNLQRFIFTTAGAARPTGSAYVEWVGPVQPSGMLDGDTWVNTA